MEYVNDDDDDDSIMMSGFLINLSSLSANPLFPVENWILTDRCYEQQGGQTAVRLSNRIISFFFSIEQVRSLIVSLD